MTTFREALRTGVLQALCAALEEPGVALAILRFVGRSPQLVLTAALALLIARQICNRNENPPPPQPQFVGGQCNGVIYRVVIDIIADNDGPGRPCREVPLSLSYRRWGPVQNIRLSNPGIGSCGEGFRDIEFFDRGDVNTDPPTSPLQWRAIFTNIVIRRIVSITVTRPDGQPDNCGNPPSTIPETPPDGFTQIVDITFDSPTGPVSIPVTFAFFNAFLDASFNLQIPVTFTFDNTVNFNAIFDVQTGDLVIQFFPYNSPPPGQPPQRPPQLPPGSGGPNQNETLEPPPPPPPGPEFEDEDLPPEPTQNRLIRAVAVTVLSDDNDRTIIFQDGGNPDILVPDIGMVQFKVLIGRSVFWTINQRVSNIRAIIPCEWEGGAIEVRGTPRPGIIWTLTPIYATPSIVNATE